MEDNKNINIALYVRVAYKDTTKNKYYINLQKNVLIEYVKENYSKCKYKFYIDNGYSGLDYERPFLKKMIKDIHHNKIDIIICKDINRIGREPITVLYSIVRKSGIKFISIDDNIIFQSHIFRELVNMLSKILIKDKKQCLEDAIKNKVKN